MKLLIEILYLKQVRHKVVLLLVITLVLYLASPHLVKDINIKL